MRNLSEMMKNITPEQEEKIMVCETAEAIQAVAAAEGLEITVEQAEEIVKMKRGRKLTEDELSEVSAGGGNILTDYYKYR